MLVTWGGLEVKPWTVHENWTEHEGLKSEDSCSVLIQAGRIKTAVCREATTLVYFVFSIFVLMGGYNGMVSEVKNRALFM